MSPGPTNSSSDASFGRLGDQDDQVPLQIWPIVSSTARGNDHNRSMLEARMPGVSMFRQELRESRSATSSGASRDILCRLCFCCAMLRRPLRAPISQGIGATGTARKESESAKHAPKRQLGALVNWGRRRGSVIRGRSARAAMGAKKINSLVAGVNFLS